MTADQDCDDADPSVSPQMAETPYDGVDNDCDDQTPDDDLDGDGVLIVVDCDDADDAIHPGAEEVCDGRDQDCDTLADDEDAVDTRTWYRDQDEDGTGDADMSTTACEQPSGYVAASDDCDDADADRYPGATELCGDGAVNDCEGQVADAMAACGPRGAASLGDAHARLLGVALDDHAGTVAGAGDVDGDGLADLLVGANQESSAGARAGAAYLVRGAPSGATSLSEADARLLGAAAGDYAGIAVSGAGDVDGDELDDLLLGALGESTRGAQAGAAYLVQGPVTGDLSLSEADARLLGAAAGDYAGIAVSGAGDVDGDGLSDLLVGASGADEAGAEAGAAWLALGPVSGELQLSEADARIFGEADHDLAGRALSGAGDVDGDGLSDLLVGACSQSTGGSGAGAAYLLLGPVEGERSLADAEARLLGEAEGDYACTVSDAGDVDGDGRGDLLVGAYLQDAGGQDAGAAYLVHGPVTGDLGLEDADATLTGEAEGDQAGLSVSGAGDVDGDDDDDLLVGALGHGASGTEAGAAYLLLGPVSGTASLSGAHAVLRGAAAGDRAGHTVSGAGDVDGDGRDDLLVGAYLEDSGAPNAGASYLVLGGGGY